MKGQEQSLGREEIGALVESYYDDVLSYCRRHTCTMQDAQDATQETFLRFVRTFANYSDRGKPLAYLITIARNVCIDVRRSCGPSCEPLDIDIADSSDEASAIDLGLLIQQLPADLREAIELRYDQGLRVKEVALVLGVSRFSAMRTIDRALKVLRNGLRPDESKEEVEKL